MEHETQNHKRHLWIMVLCCLIPLVAFGAIWLFKVPLSSALTIALFLLCPLSHMVMMRLMGRKEHDHAPEHTADTLVPEGHVHLEAASSRDVESAR